MPRAKPMTEEERKARQSEYLRKWRAANLEKAREYGRRHYAANRASKCAAARERAKVNRLALNAHTRAQISSGRPLVILVETRVPQLVVRALLAAKGWDERTLALRLGYALQTIRSVISGCSTNAIARAKIEELFSAKIWPSS